MITINITHDGTATLTGEGMDTKTLAAGSYHQAQAEAIDLLIDQARAAGTTLHALVNEEPPTRLQIEHTGTVTPVTEFPETPEDASESALSSPEDAPEVTPAEPVVEAQSQAPSADSPRPLEDLTPEPEAPAPATEPVAQEPAPEHPPVAPSPTPARPNPLTHVSEPASRRQLREQRESFLNQEHREQPATEGWRGFLASMGMRIAPSPAEKSQRADRKQVSQHWPGPRTIAVVNGKGGANKTPTTICLSAVFARYGGGTVLAYDNNQTRGTLGWRTEQGPHEATILDLLPQANELLSPGAQSADLAHYVHHQTTDRYDVLRSKPAHRS